MADPLDKQLVEAVLTRPRSGKADLEEAKLARAKAIERGEQLVEAPWKGIVSLHEWTLHDTERKTRTAKTQHRLPLGPEAHQMVQEAMADEATAELLVQTPDFHLQKYAR